MPAFKRHDLVWLSDEGVNFALRNIQSCVPFLPENEIEALLRSYPPIPAIVTRQDPAGINPADKELLCVGFSFPVAIDGIRLRAGCKIPPESVVRRMTPFDVAGCGKYNFPAGKLLKALVKAGRRRNIRAGCFGSAALQMVTALPYWNENSDLDIYLLHSGKRREPELFFQRLLSLEKRSGFTIDAEIECKGQYGVKLKELFAPGKTVLGKGLFSVVLLDKLTALD